MRVTVEVPLWKPTDFERAAAVRGEVVSQQGTGFRPAASCDVVTAVCRVGILRSWANVRYSLPRGEQGAFFLCCQGRAVQI